MNSAVKPLRPRGPGWMAMQLSLEVLAEYGDGTPPERWHHRAYEVQVMSSVDVENDAIVGERLFHLSMSIIRLRDTRARRVSTARARWVLQEFDAEDFFEVTLKDSVLRHFYRTVNEVRHA